MPFLFCFFLLFFLRVLFSVFKPSWGPKERLMKNNHPCLDGLAKGLISHRAIPSGRVFSRYITASPAFIQPPPALPHVGVSVAALTPGTMGPQPAPRVAVQRLTCTKGRAVQVVASCPVPAGTGCPARCSLRGALPCCLWSSSTRLAFWHGHCSILLGPQRQLLLYGCHPRT